MHNGPTHMEDACVCACVRACVRACVQRTNAHGRCNVRHAAWHVAHNLRHETLSACCAATSERKHRAAAQRVAWRASLCAPAPAHSVERAIPSAHPSIHSIHRMLKPKTPRHPRDTCLQRGSLHPSIYPDLGIHTRVCVQAVLERLVNDAARRIDEINARHEATAAEAASALSAESARVERAESEIAVLQANQTLPPLLLPVPPCRASVVPN